MSNYNCDIIAKFGKKTRIMLSLFESFGEIDVRSRPTSRRLFTHLLSLNEKVGLIFKNALIIHD